MEDYIKEFSNRLIELAPQLVGALILLLVGLWIIKIILRFINKITTKREVDISVAKFLRDILKWTLRIILFLMVISKLGINTTSFIAMLGAAGLAVGMALQGSLANFAGGILIIIFKPFKVGDYITAQDQSGTVTEISIFTTKLTTVTNQLVVIPNGKLSNDKVINYSAFPHRREMLDIEIDYAEDIKKAKKVILELAMNDPRIIKDENIQPMPQIMVTSLGANGIILNLRYWADSGDFWDVRFDMLENIKNVLEAEDISIPYSQQDIRIKEFPRQEA